MLKQHRYRGLQLLGMAAAIGNGAGCLEEDVVCPSRTAVVFEAPTAGATIVQDSALARPGLQTPVIVRSNLLAGESVILTVRGLGDDDAPMRYESLADRDGTAVFTDIDLPYGSVELEAVAVSDQCENGDARIEIVALDGGGSQSCELTLKESAADNAYYDPFAVLARIDDLDQDAAGLQAAFEVRAPAGFAAELSVLDIEAGGETSLGTAIVGADGVAEFLPDLQQGKQSVRAICRSNDGAIVADSASLLLFIDTEAPTCNLINPAEGVVFTDVMDADGDLNNGFQVDLAGVAVGGGASGDPSDLDPASAAISIDGNIVEGGSVTDDGRFTVRASLDPGIYDIAFSSSDYAGNQCTVKRSHTYVSGEGLTLAVRNRYTVEALWKAPDVASYIVKVASEELGPDNFADAGQVVATPLAGGVDVIEKVTISPLSPGESYYVAVAGVPPNDDGGDVDGDPGTPFVFATAGPITPDFDSTGGIGAIAPEDGENSLGYRVARGDFNADGVGDLAVSAPFKSVEDELGVGTVYIYLGNAEGGAGGIDGSAGPDVTIAGAAPGAQFGNGLAVLDWNGDNTDDLIVGAPLGLDFSGQVFVFLGGANLSSDMSPADADVTISAGNGWFQTSGLGFALSAAHFDGDGRDDLIMSAPAGGNGNGGIVVLYGGTLQTDIVLSDLDESGSGDARVWVLEDPDSGSINDGAAFFGHYLHNLGPTEGSLDANDDIGVAYTENNAAVVFRGRNPPADPGVTVVALDPARDLHVVRESPDTTTRFGSAMAAIDDIDGDGSRDIVIGTWREGANVGFVAIVDGDAVGTAQLNDITLTTILAAADTLGVGSAIANNIEADGAADVDGDGREDLLITAGIDGEVTLLVWYGGEIPMGVTDTDSAHYRVKAPAAFRASARGDSDGTPIAALWAGDVNGDGVEDICLADYSVDDRDGMFTVLYDDGI